MCARTSGCTTSVDPSSASILVAGRSDARSISNGEIVRAEKVLSKMLLSLLWHQSAGVQLDLLQIQAWEDATAFWPTSQGRVQKSIKRHLQRPLPPPKRGLTLKAQTHPVTVRNWPHTARPDLAARVRSIPSPQIHYNSLLSRRSRY